MRAHFRSAHELSALLNVEEIDSVAEHLRFLPRDVSPAEVSDPAPIYLGVTKGHGVSLMPDRAVPSIPCSTPRAG
jgi:hypothetical protein